MGPEVASEIAPGSIGGFLQGGVACRLGESRPVGGLLEGGAAVRLGKSRILPGNQSIREQSKLPHQVAVGPREELQGFLQATCLVGGQARRPLCLLDDGNSVSAGGVHDSRRLLLGLGHEMLRLLLCLACQRAGRTPGRA